MIHQFQSEFIRGGNPIRPQLITIEKNTITIKQRTKILIGNKTQTIKFNSIANTQLIKNPISTKIIIETNGGSQIIIDNLNNNDAQSIINLINN
jgi:3-deoxy-D-arabino-heptulosonate 7-phosphate (DAHP) synthase class II